MKTISIMMTTYNLEDYVDNAIRSVVSQEMPCFWELLIGDDGSTDGTIGIINSWVNKYPENIRLYQWNKEEIHSMNGFRAAANRANLLEKAKGDYLIFLDGDDCWLGTEKLKLQFEILENSEFANCSCCGHNIFKYHVDSNSGKNMVDSRYQQRVFTKKDYYRHGMYIHTNTILFRNNCKSIMLESLNRGFLNDVFITFLILQCGNMFYLPESYAQYNITGTGLWTGSNKVYSRFRNLQLYDLERHIDPHLEPLIFRGFCTNMEVILNEYTRSDIPKIYPLVENLDSEVFEYTLLLFGIVNQTPKNRAFKILIRWRIFFAKVNYYLFNVKRKLKLV